MQSYKTIYIYIYMKFLIFLFDPTVRPMTPLVEPVTQLIDWVNIRSSFNKYAWMSSLESSENVNQLSYS